MEPITASAAEAAEEKRRELFFRQVALLKQFRKTGALSEAQFRTSYDGLVTKMGMERYADDGR